MQCSSYRFLDADSRCRKQLPNFTRVKNSLTTFFTQCCLINFRSIVSECNRASHSDLIFSNDLLFKTEAWLSNCFANKFLSVFEQLEVLYRTDRQNGRNGGMAILVEYSLHTPVRQLQLPITFDFLSLLICWL